MDPLSMVTAAALLLAGYLLGRRERKKTKSNSPQLKCGCTHHLSVHDPITGKCKASISVPKWSGHDIAGHEYRPCACQQYIGPQYVPDFLPSPPDVHQD